ncbi:MAG: GNAT family N-acetyltransferase [Candidatus Zixiibacteriota bacterium]
MTISVHTITKQDIPWVKEIFQREWGGDFIVSNGRKLVPEQLQGFYAADDSGNRVGLATYEVVGKDCELVSLNSFSKFAGIGSALITQVTKMAAAHGCHRIWLTTSNDNLDALRFYQRRGYAIVGVNRNAIDETRKLKPTIPALGSFGIPIRDEIILEVNIAKPDEQR